MSASPTKAPPRLLPAAASVALAPLLAGPQRQARLLGVVDAAAYLAAGDDVVAVVAADAVRLPNALVVAPPASAAPFAGLAGLAADGAGAVRFGAGAVRFGALVVPARRWFDPTPRLPAVAPEDLRRRLRVLPTLTCRAAGAQLGVDAAGEQLATAARHHDLPAAVAAAARLVGAGRGLTPAGDDVLAGLLAGLRLLPAALPAGSWQRQLTGFVDGLAAAVCRLARGRTPVLSAALLAHAGRGEVAEPAGRLLLALAGRGDLAAAAAALTAVGHSSGRDLAAGIAAGAGAVLAAEARR